ncbi:MAG: hypothetical protein LBI64_08760 [Coriobacteriales bacterium]|jgi:hypothetical protein|nr:hypothetical protein [Coriobacteriales bacterium]
MANSDYGWVRSLGPPGFDLVISINRGFEDSILSAEIRFNPRRFIQEFYTHESFEELHQIIDYGRRGYPQLISDFDGFEHGQLSIAMNTVDVAHVAVIVDAIGDWFTNRREHLLDDAISP